MIFQDNVLKEYLKNVYFVTGTPCGGKTTISRELAKKYNLMVYDVDERFPNHLSMSNARNQPAMNKVFQNADEFFGRTVEEYSKWILDNTREQLDYVIMDLISISQNRTVICDLHLTLEEADLLTEYDRIVFLIKNPLNIIDEYCNRADHEGVNRYINSAANPELAKQNCNQTLEHIYRKKYEQIKKSDYLWIERDCNSTVENTVRQVEKHFRLL